MEEADRFYDISLEDLAEGMAAGSRLIFLSSHYLRGGRAPRVLTEIRRAVL